jgi:ribosomal protein L10
MKSAFKTYKINKIKSYFKKKSCVILCHVPNSSAKNWLKIQKQFYNYNIKCYKIHNNITKEVLSNSIFKNLVLMPKGSVCLIYFEEETKLRVKIQQLLTLNKSILILGLKLNNKVYSYSQLKTLFTINYEKNVKVFQKSLKKLLKLPYTKFN